MMSMFWIVILVFVNYSKCLEINEVFAWKQVKFDWPSDEFELKAIENQAYIPQNNLPFGLAKWKNKMFVTIPRWKAGVASTLNYIEISSDKTPLLIPYPSWDTNYIENTTVKEMSIDSELPIVSVFRVFVDVCDRLWILDDGTNNKLGGNYQVVKKSLIIYDLNTNKLLQRYFFTDREALQNSFFANVVVDVTKSNCDSAFAYIADVSRCRLVVYNMKENLSWNIKHLYFYPDPLAGDIVVSGIRTHWADGILSLTLSNIRNDGYRILYFYSLTSTTEFQVSTKVLMNSTWMQDKQFYDYFEVLGDRGERTQSTTSCFDEKTGTLYFTQVNKNGLAKWNINSILKSSTFISVLENDTILEFPADIKIDEDRNILVLSNKLPRFMYDELDGNIINFRVISIPVDSI